MKSHHRLFLLIVLMVWAYPTAGLTGVPDVQSLDGTWQIVFDHDNQGKEQQWFYGDHFPHDGTRSIAVPSCWELTEKDYEGVAFYRRAFRVPTQWQGKVVRLQFDAFNFLAEVWLNDTAVGLHEGGFTPFEFRIDDLLKFDEDNILTLRVVGPILLQKSHVDGVGPMETPQWRGAITGGIWQPVRLIATAALAVSGWPQLQAAERPNVVLIVCDDLNDYVTGMGGHPQAKTPHIAKLAASGVAFRHAYSNNPICAPSRSSFLTGIYPHTSGNLYFDKWFENPVLSNSRTLMEHFRANGYHVVGSGKLMHHHQPSVWSEFKHKADYGPFVFDGQERVAHPSVPEPFRSIGSVDGSFAPLDNVPFADDGDPQTGWIYGTWGKTVPLRYNSDTDRDPTPDERNAAWAADRIEQFATQPTDQPFFLAVGFIRPHTPLHVPKKYFAMFPLESLELPLIKAGDADDCHYADLVNDEQKGVRYFRLLNESYPDLESGLKAFTQAYLACVTAVDECIGQVIDAVDRSPLRDNTIIVVTSDHGWQMGQKDYLFKDAPWEDSTRVPFVIRAPGVTRAGGIAEHPVSLIDLYPTLVDLCRLEGDTRKSAQGALLDGHSVRPFLEDPENGQWDGPDAALTMIFVGSSRQKFSKSERQQLDNQHWTIRTRRWRYIRYNNGAEELYDHDNDAREWTNLADVPEYEDVKEQLRAKLLEMRNSPSNPSERGQD